jgi:hypothetical protein
MGAPVRIARASNEIIRAAEKPDEKARRVAGF